MPCAFRCAGLAALLSATLCLAAAQDKTAPTATPTVEVRLQISWWTEPASGYPRVAVVTLDPLDGKSAPQTLRVSESSTTIVRLVPGRYQLTTTSPLMFNRQAYGWSIELPLVSPVNYIRLSQENAVRLAPGEAIEAADFKLSASRSVRSSNALASEAETRSQIAALLNRWTTSLKSRSLAAQMTCYAPRMANYLQQANLSREQVELQKRKLLRNYTHIQQLELSNIKVESSGSQAAATAVKNWIFRNDEVDWRGRALVEFKFTKIDSRWVIISEQERTIPARSLAVQAAAPVSRASAER